MKVKIVLGPISKTAIKSLGEADAKSVLQMLMEGTEIKIGNTYRLDEGKIPKLIEKMQDNATQVNILYSIRMGMRLGVLYQKKNSVIIILGIRGRV